MNGLQRNRNANERVSLAVVMRHKRGRYKRGRTGGQSASNRASRYAIECSKRARKWGLSVLEVVNCSEPTHTRTSEPSYRSTRREVGVGTATAGGGGARLLMLSIRR